MNYQNSAIPSEARVKVTLQQAVVHHFQNKNKDRVAQGPCKIYSTELTDETPSNEKTYYISVNNFIDEVESTKIFVRINYPENTSFLFQKQNWGICTISFNKNRGAQQFDKLFNHFAVILDFNSQNVSENLKLKIQQNCPDNIQTKDITSDAKTIFKKVGKTIGWMVGGVSNVISKNTSGAATSISERASRISRDSISQQTKTKWNNVKQKSSSINQSLTQMVMPIVNKYRSIEDAIALKFKNSQNKVIKTVREYGEAFSQSVNEGEKSTHEEQPVAFKDQQSKCDLK